MTSLTCGTPVTSTHNGAGAWNVNTSGVSTPGREKIYSFTPATTGAYTLQVTALMVTTLIIFIKRSQMDVTLPIGFVSVAPLDQLLFRQ